MATKEKLRAVETSLREEIRKLWLALNALGVR